MHPSPTRSAVAPGADSSLRTDMIPLTIIRTETVLSRLPIHTLAKKGYVTIHITRTNAHGDIDLRWEVSYNTRYGPPRQLAYKLDTLVITRCLDALARPLPKVIRVGSIAQICASLGLAAGGRSKGHVKRALLQNALTAIVAKLRYKGVDGTACTLEAAFTRYSVVFAGMKLPDGTTADAVYLLLNDQYWQVLNNAPVRPLDYDYLQELPPTAQRFYELVSYKMFAALARKQPAATLRYAEYCLFAPQPRYTTYDQVKKQLYKVHKPHLASGYLAQVHTEATTDSDGHPDWWLHYVPGPKARAEYAAFTRSARSAAAPDTVRQDVEPLPDTPPGEVSPMTQAGDLAVGAAPASPATSPATALVQYFYQRFHGWPTAPPPAKALRQAEALIAEHGEGLGRFLVDYAHREAPKTEFHPRHFGGLLGYVPDALAAYPRWQAQRAQQAHAAQEAQARAQYDAYVQQALACYIAMVLPDERARLETAVRAQVIADRTIPPCAQAMEVRLRTEAALLAQAGIPTFDTWQQAQQEVHA